MSDSAVLRWYSTESTASAGVAKTVLNGGIAAKGLIFVNKSASNVMHITFDGTAASATHGLPIAANGGIYEFKPQQIPQDALSVFCTAADAYMVAYA